MREACVLAEAAHERQCIGLGILPLEQQQIGGLGAKISQGALRKHGGGSLVAGALQAGAHPARLVAIRTEDYDLWGRHVKKSFHSLLERELAPIRV